MIYCHVPAQCAVYDVPHATRTAADTALAEAVKELSLGDVPLRIQWVHACPDQAFARKCFDGGNHHFFKSPWWNFLGQICWKTVLKTGEIRLMSHLSPTQARLTVRHECRHVWQRKRI